MAALTARPKTCLGFALLAVLKTTTSAPLSNNADLEGVFLKMEEDVIAFRREVERVYTQARCSSQTLEGCIKGNYDDCFSEFPNPTCPSKEVSFAQIDECSTSNKETDACGSGLFDYTVPNVIIPGVLTNGRDGNPVDKKVSSRRE